MTNSEDQLGRPSNWLWITRSDDVQENHISVFHFSFCAFHMKYLSLFIYTNDPSEELKTLIPAHTLLQLNIYNFYLLNIKLSFPESNSDSTKKAGGERRGNTNHLSASLCSHWIALPRHAAIFVVLTLISSYEALGAAEVPVVIIFFQTQPFSLSITNFCSLPAWLQAFTDSSPAWNSMYWWSVCNLITNLICLLPHCVIYFVPEIH